MAQRTMERSVVLSMNQQSQCQSVKSVLCRWYSSSSTGLLELGEILYWIGVLWNLRMPISIFATPSTVLKFSGSIGLSLWVTLLVKVPFSAYTFTRLLWMVGAVIAAAGMQVYIIWGSVRRGRSRTTIHLIFHSGLTSQRWGEELPRISRSQTQVTHHIYVRRECSTPWYASFFKSNFLLYVSI